MVGKKYIKINDFGNNWILVGWSRFCVIDFVIGVVDFVVEWICLYVDFS